MDAIVQIDKLERRLGGCSVIKGVSAAVLPGQVVALLGKNGAGKTTLLETLLGFAVPSAGKALLWGVAAANMDDAIKQRIGFVPQQDELLPGMSGAEHLRLFKSFRKRWNQELVDRLVQEWLIPLDRPLAKLSVGQRQKMALLLAMAHEPELLVLDEPVASLDPLARRQFLQQLVEIASDERRSIVLSTHIVSDVERVANQVWMLRDGNLVYQGDIDTLKENVVRVRLYSERVFTQPIAFANVLQQKLQGRTAELVFSHWREANAEVLAQQFNAQLSVEYLSLEDIFLELNA